MSPAEPPLLQFRGAAKSFPSGGATVRAVRDLHLDIFPRDWIVATGPSGSGKSTFLHMAALLEPASDGEIWFDGRRADSLDEAELAWLRGASIGMVFQRFHLLPRRSVLENVLFRYRYLQRNPRAAHTGAMAALAQVGLEDRAHAAVLDLSGGEMQRVAIARALAFRPRLLAADEPTGNLDATAAAEVMDCFRRVHASGTAVLLVTHNPAWIGWGTRHLRFNDGRVSEGP